MHLKPVLLIAVTCVLNEIQSVCKFSSMYTHSLIYVSSRFCMHLRCTFLHSFCSGNVIEATSTGISISSLQEAGKKISVSYWSWRVSDRQPGLCVQVCVLILQHMQLLFNVYIQPHSCKDKACPKFNSTSKGPTPSQVTEPEPEKCPGELLIS